MPFTVEVALRVVVWLDAINRVTLTGASRNTDDR